MFGKLWMCLVGALLTITAVILAGCQDGEEVGFTPTSTPEATPAASAIPTSRAVAPTQAAPMSATTAPTQAVPSSPAITPTHVEVPLSPEALQAQPGGPTESPVPTLPEGTGLSLETIEEIMEDISEVQETFPIAEVLPYGGPFDNQPFFIFPPTKDGTIRIDIEETSDIERTKELAFDWIRSQGYDPEEYTFEFKVRAFPAPVSTTTPAAPPE